MFAIGRCGQPQSEHAALAWVALGLDKTTVPPSDLLAQKKAQASAWSSHVLLGRQPAKALEEKRYVLGGNANSTVADGYECRAAPLADFNLNPISFWRVFDCVVEEIGNNRRNPVAVGRDKDWSFGLDDFNRMQVGN